MITLLITINPGLQIVGFLPAGNVGDAYTAMLTVRGGLEPYQISVVSLLPDGLTWVDNGDGTLTISGTPTEPFDGMVMVRAEDGRRNPVQRPIGLVVLDIPEVPAYFLIEDDDFLLLKTGDRLRLKNG